MTDWIELLRELARFYGWMPWILPPAEDSPPAP